MFAFVFQRRRRQQNTAASDAASIASSMTHETHPTKRNDLIREMEHTRSTLVQRYHSNDDGESVGENSIMTVFSTATTVKAGSPEMQKKAKLLAAALPPKGTRMDDDTFSLGSARTTRSAFWRVRGRNASESKSVVSMPSRLMSFRLLPVARLRRISSVTSRAAMDLEAVSEYPEEEYNLSRPERTRKQVPLQLARFILSQESPEIKRRESEATSFGATLDSHEMVLCEF